MTISDILAEARSLTDTDSTSYPNAVLLRRCNNAYEEIVGKLIARNSRWQFDDSNYTSFPIGYTTLVAGQQDYTFDTAHLIIERVQVKDSSGIWQLLRPINMQDIGMPREEYQKTNGLPMEYDKSGSSILLFPAPSAATTTLTAGMRVYFQRTASIFTSDEVTTGTKVPGFASPYHILLAYKAAIPYCLSYKKDRVPLLMAEAKRLEDELMAFEASKDKDDIVRLSTNGISFR